MATKQYPARLDIAYPEKLDRVSTFFRLLFAIPILIIFGLLTGAGGESFASESNSVSSGGSGILGGLFIVTLLMILFRQRYPRWWFDFNLELTRFSTRISAYLALMTDQYPSTVDKQTVTLDVDYPDAEKLSRGLPLVKWLLVLPHYFVLFFLFVASFVAVVIAWFAILFTGKYPRELFDFVLGVFRWELRVTAYAFLLTTDEYPPFTLK
jgi:hypothetical protein